MPQSQKAKPRTNLPRRGGIDSNVQPGEGPVVRGDMDALLSRIKKLQPRLGQGLGSGAARCKCQVLGDAFHKDEPRDRSQSRPSCIRRSHWPDPRVAPGPDPRLKGQKEDSEMGSRSMVIFRGLYDEEPGGWGMLSLEGPQGVLVGESSLHP